MPIASWDDVADIDGPAANVASFDDIVSLEPPPARANVASFDEILSIDPPRPAGLPTMLQPRPAAPPTSAFPTLTVARTPAESMGVPAGLELPVATTPQAALASLKPQPLAPAPPVVEDPITPHVRSMRNAVGETAVGAVEFAKKMGPAGFGAGSVIPGRVDASGALTFTPPPDELRQGTDAVLAAGQRALQATTPAEATAAARETLTLAASLPLDLLGVPVSAVRQALKVGDVGRALGLIVGTLGVMGGIGAAEKLGGGHGRSVGAEPLRDLSDRPVAPAERIREGTGGTASIDDVVAVEPPAPTAEPAGVGPAAEPVVGIGHVSDIVAIEPPKVDEPRPGGAPPEAAGVNDAEAQVAISNEARAAAAAAPTDAPRPGAPVPEAPVSPAVDVLDTGERQVRLPEAGAVRDQNVATPAIAEVPFSLESEPATSTPVQPTLTEAPPAPVEPPKPPKREPRGVRADPAEWADVSPAERRELRRIVTELDTFPYVKKNFNEAGRGRGGQLEVSGGAGGAEVYYDIVGGDPDGHRPVFSGTRAEVRDRVRRFIDEGRRSVTSDLAVDVARRRLEGDRSLRAAALPPEAGESNAIDVAPRKGLPPEHAAVQREAITALERDPDRYVAEYRQKFGNVVNADNAKELFPAYATSPETRTANDVAVHRPASALAHATFRRMLEEPTPEGRTRTAVFTIGGTGAGKTTSLREAFPGAEESAHVVYDSTMPSVDDVRRARRTGHDVAVVLTDREIEEAWQATLQRARDIGRPVNLATHVLTHERAARSFQALRQAFSDDAEVQFYVVRNSTAAGRELVPLAEWQPRSYNVPDVRARLEAVLDAEHAAGRVDDALFEAARLPARVEATRPAEQVRVEVGERPQNREDSAGGVRALEPGARDSGEGGPADGGSEPLARPKRADASGALVPSPGSRAISLLSPGEKQLRPSEIVRDLSKSLDELPVRVGRFKQQALGIYKPKEQTIRLKVANDLDTLAHELGHHIHESLIGAELPPKVYRDELLPLGAATSRGSYTLKQRLQEGQAEFTRYYLSDPAEALKRAPKYYAAFEQGMGNHPELGAILQRAQRQYVGHLSADAATRGMAHIDFSGQDPNPKADFVTRLQTAVVDDLYPVRRMVEDLQGATPIDTSKNGYALARLARGSSAKADGFLRHGVRAADGTFLAGSLEHALAPVKKQAREFAGYLTAQRAIELRGRGMETGMSLDEARAIVTKYQSPAFDTARQAVYDYQEATLTYAQRAGALSKDQLAQIRALNKAYVPFQRVLDDVGAAAAGGKGSLANRGNPTKRIKGSGRDIVNPLESIVRNTHSLVNLVEQNRAMLALVDQADRTIGGGRYLEKVPPKQLATMFNLDKVAEAIKEELDNAGVEIPDNLDFDRMVKVFTPAAMPMGDRGIITVLRDGKREWYSVNDQALFDAITAIAPKSSDLLVNLFMRPARALRAGATTTVSFIARNPIRDTFEATVNSRYGFRLGYDTVRGLFEFLKHGDDYQNYLNSGAGNSALVAADRNRIRKELSDLGLRDRTQLMKDIVTSPIDLLRAVSEAMEHATRLGEFKRAVDVEGRSAEGYARAALAARDVTIDFARGGAASKEINRYTAFFNAGVQGTARLAEVFARDPAGATMRATAAIMVPSIALWVLNQNDPEYRELPEWEKNIYWHLPIGRGAGHAWAKIPKPFTLGQIFGNSAEAALDYLGAHQSDAFHRFLPDKNTAWHLVVSILPTAIMPAVEAYTNYDTFRDRAIVNPDDLNLDLELQASRWTSELAKTVGPKMGLAPAKLDHLIYGYGAGLATGVVQGSDSVLGKLGLVDKQKPATGPGRWPFVGAFYREAAGADAESLQDFYRLRDQVQGATGSIRRYGKRDEPERAAARAQAAVGEFGGQPDTVLARVSQAAPMLTDLRGGVDQVFANRTLEPAEKKELLDRIYEQMINVARGGLGKPPLPSRFSKPPDSKLLDKLAVPQTSAGKK